MRAFNGVLFGRRARIEATMNEDCPPADQPQPSHISEAGRISHPLHIQPELVRADERGWTGRLGARSAHAAVNFLLGRVE